MVKKWVNENYYELKKYLSCLKIDEFDDVYHEVLLQFIDGKKSLKVIENGKSFQYILAMMKINAFSKNGVYKNKYKYLKKDVKYENDGIICYADVHNYLHHMNNIQFIYKYIYVYYIKQKEINPSYSIKELSRETNLSSSTIHSKFTQIKKYIISSYEEDRNN